MPNYVLIILTQSYDIQWNYPCKQIVDISAIYVIFTVLDYL